MNLFNKIILMIYLLCVLTTCTYNPLFEDELDSSDGHTISGIINLNSGDTQDNIAVWLEALNIGTYTDKNGYFNLTLPLPIVQPENGISTESRLYYYLANYAYDYSNVKLLNGKVMHSALDISNKGKINREINLDKLVSIRTCVEPDTITMDYDGKITVKVTVSPQKMSVQIKTFAGNLGSDFFDGLLYKHENDSDSAAVFLRFSTILKSIELTKTQSWFINLNAEYLNLKQGNYVFIPYIVIDQPGLPEDLFVFLDEFPGQFTNKYLNVPFKRQDGLLYVTDSDN